MSEPKRSTRRRYLAVASAGSVGVLAGCLSDDDSSGDDGSTADSNDTIDDEPETNDSSEETLTIGHIAPGGSPLGVGSLRTAEMAVEELNGRDTGLRVELKSRDTRADPVQAQTAVDELINQEDADVIVGGFSSEVARQVIELTSAFDVPYLSTGPADPNLSTNFVGESYDEYKQYFRIGPLNAEFQTEAIRDYCVHLSDRHGWNSLTFYRDNAAWTEVYGNQLPGLLEDEGLTIEASDAVGRDSPDLSPLITETRETGADYVLRLFAHVSNSPSQLLAPWHEAQYDFGIEGIHVAGMHPELDQLAEGVCVYEGTGQYGAGGVAPITERTQPFIEDYRAVSGGASPAGSPMPMGFGTFDAVHLLADVTAEIGTTRFSSNLDAFVDAMLGVEFTGVGSEISFYGPDGEYPHDLKPTRNADGQITNYPFTQWQPDDDRPGQIECVYPTGIQTAEHVQPAWMQ